MAEAPPPPPPPNLDYNSFRTWRKNNGIRGTQQELKIAWNKYKSSNTLLPGKKSPVRSPSKKTSPKKSPIKTPSYANVVAKTHTQQLLGAPTLANVPKDVGEYISSFLPSRSLALLQSTSKATRIHSRQQLALLCSELPSKGEILSYLKDQLTFPSTVFFIPPTEDTENNAFTDVMKVVSSNGTLRITHERLNRTHLTTHENTRIHQYQNIEANITGLIDPMSLLDILKRRKSCINNPNYGVELAQAYLRVNAIPVLRLLMDESEIDTVFSEDKPMDSVVLKPVPARANRMERNVYITSLIRLEILIKWVMSSPHELSGSLDSLLALVRPKLGMFRKAYHDLETYQSVRIPYDTSGVLEYIQKRLKSGQPTKVTFLGAVDSSIVGAYAPAVHELNMKTMNSGVYTITTIGENHEVAADKHPTAGPLALQEMLRTKMPLGTVDLQTMRAILDEQGLYSAWKDTLLAIRERVANALYIRPLPGNYEDYQRDREALESALMRETEDAQILLLSRTLLFLRWLGVTNPNIAGLHTPLTKILKTYEIISKLYSLF